MQPHDFWQELRPARMFATSAGYHEFYPAMLEDGRQIQLPIRVLSDGVTALASLIINQASFSVLDALSADLAARLRPFEPEIVIGLPTLGLTLATAVAGKLGHDRYVPLGASRKFWYSDELSTPMSSITTPGHKRQLYMDPRMLPLVIGRRIALIDDVISTGTSMLAGLTLAATCGVEPVVIGAAMLQSDRWRTALADRVKKWPALVRACFSSPLLKRGADGLWT